MWYKDESVRVLSAMPISFRHAAFQGMLVKDPGVVKNPRGNISQPTAFHTRVRGRIGIDPVLIITRCWPCLLFGEVASRNCMHPSTVIGRLGLSSYKAGTRFYPWPCRRINTSRAQEAPPSLSASFDLTFIYACVGHPRYASQLLSLVQHRYTGHPKTPFEHGPRVNYRLRAFHRHFHRQNLHSHIRILPRSEGRRRGP